MYMEVHRVTPGRVLLARVRGLFGRRRAEAALDEEIQTHLDLLTAEYIRRGLTEDVARHTARLEFGGVEPLKERVRDQRGIRWLDDIAREARHAVRSLWQAPVFTATAVLTLALAIGAATTMFTVVDGVLLRSLPFPEADRLTMIQPTSGSRVSPAYLGAWRTQGRTFADIAGWYDAPTNLTGNGDTVEVQADRTTTNFFRVLGVPALLGRTFSTTPDLTRDEPEVVLGYALWQRSFGGAPDVIGRRLTLDGRAYTVVGVMPEAFTIRTNELAESRAELWLPFPLVDGNPVGMGGSLNVVGRLRNRATVDQARRDLVAVSHRIEAQYPSYSHDWSVRVLPLLDATVKDIRPMLLLLFGGVGLLLLISYVNVANLTLVRAIRRQQEWATRMAVGATRGHIARQVLTETGVLAVLAASLGVLVSAWTTSALVAWVPSGVDLPRTAGIGFDVRVLLFAVALAAVTTIGCGLASLIKARGIGAGTALAVREGHAPGGWGRVTNGLIVSEIALSVMLAAGAGLLVRTVWSLMRIDPGFRAEHVLTLRTSLPPERYATAERIHAFGDALLQRIDALPGVRAAGFSSYLPLTHFGVADSFDIDDGADGRVGEKWAWTALVDGAYFEAMGIPLLRGRLPGNADFVSSGPRVFIDETLAKRYWPGKNPVGSRITTRHPDGQTVTGEIIGVVGSVRWQTLSAAPPATTYWWFPSLESREISIVVRTSGDPAAIARRVAAQVTAIDPYQGVADVRAMGDIVSADLARPRFTMFLLLGFGSMAVLLAVIGVYGVIAFAVDQRRREIAVRIALGAHPHDVIMLLLGRGALLITGGVVGGIGGELAAGRYVAGLIHGVVPADPAALAAAAAILAVAGMLAVYVPAQRAGRIDPMVTIRGQ